MTINDLITEIIRWEGSNYTNDSVDRGGPTKFGITQDVLSRWRGDQVSPDDVRALTEAEARTIYVHEYVEGPQFSQIANEDLRALVVDIGVNQGQPTAAKFLQEAAGVTADGRVGPQTLTAVNAMAAVPFGRTGTVHPLLFKVLALSLRAYGRLITDHPTQARFAAGWMNRRTETLDAFKL